MSKLWRWQANAGGYGQPEAGPRFPLLGVAVNAVTFAGALQFLLDAPSARRRIRGHFCSVNMLVAAADNPVLREALNSADLVAPDGMPLVWLGRLRGYSIERVCGPDIMLALLDRSRERGYRHFFYGGGEGVAEQLAATMAKRFPGLQVAGVFTPPFRPLTPDENRAITACINAAAPDYVWVGLSTPKQDLWIAEHREHLEAAALLAVGAAFDFHSGRRRRAPRWMQRTGSEWLFRLFSEPRRLGRRYTVTNLRFLQLLAAETFRALGKRARTPS